MDPMVRARIVANDRAILASQMASGRVRTGADAAREIARRIERQGGFWGPRDEDVVLPAPQPEVTLAEVTEVIPIELPDIPVGVVKLAS